jgi:hypothetical protein
MENFILPTNQGDKSIPEILDILSYNSYAANRDYGATHEQLVRVGIGNDLFKLKYEQDKSLCNN